MTAMLLRILIIAVIFAAIGFGLLRIWRDWKNQFKAIDVARRERDRQERARPDVVTLKRSEDGVYRQGEDDSR